MKRILTKNEEIVAVLPPEVHADLACVQQALYRLRHDPLPPECVVDLLKGARDVLDAIALVLEGEEMGSVQERPAGYVAEDWRMGV